MRAMAVGADRCLVRSVGHGAAVNALLVRQERLRAVAAGFHHELLAVTCATGGGDIGVIHSRFWIAGRQQLMRAAVTIGAGSGLTVASLDCLGMEAEIVGSLLVGMTGGAVDLC